jgi:hypothetical protein
LVTGHPAHISRIALKHIDRSDERSRSGGASCAAAESASMQQAMMAKACANFKASNSATSRV